MLVGHDGRQKERHSARSPRPTLCLSLNALAKGIEHGSTVAQPPIKAKYATVYDEPATIAKVNDVLYVIFEDSRIERFEVEMAPFTVVLGDCQTADDQAYGTGLPAVVPAVACSREEGVS